MTMQTRTKLATILRQLNQGIITKHDAYHMIANLYAGE